MPINFCHITPTKYLDQYAVRGGAHLILAHLVEEDEEYRNFYANLDDGKDKIMDNSAFEMYSRGLPMYESSKLIEMAKACRADYIVMSDYPGEHSSKTINKAKELIPQFKGEGFKTFFCPQSRKGDLGDLLDAFEWGISTRDVDLIGVSILACPNAFNVGRENMLQRYLSRWRVFQALDQRCPLDRSTTQRRFHCLGMLDGPNEIDLLKPFHLQIRSWDSSAAVWAGLHNIKFDSSPTGLINGKFEKEVDFARLEELTPLDDQNITHNINYINTLCR